MKLHRGQVRLAVLESHVTFSTRQLTAEFLCFGQKVNQRIDSELWRLHHQTLFVGLSTEAQQLEKAEVGSEAQNLLNGL